VRVKREMRGAIPALVAAVAVALLAAGCGSRDEPDLTQGKALFVQGCGSCHTLSRAGTQGKTGPNLDQAFDAAIQDGFNRDTIEGIVHAQIMHPIKRGVMPPKIFTGKDAQDVAAYVAYAADRSGQDTGALAQAGLAEAKTGEQIFTAAGCAGCHTLAKAGANGTIGPNLNELPSQAGNIEPGTSAEDYVKESILDPSAFVVKGFKDGVMPVYKGKLSDAQVAALVKYLLEN
jgi:mono/diheme cytochrome c family protein